MLTSLFPYPSHRRSLHPLHLIASHHRHHPHLHHRSTLRFRKRPLAPKSPAAVRGTIPTQLLPCPCLYTLINPRTHSHRLGCRDNKQHRRQHHQRSMHGVLQPSCVPLTVMSLSPMSRDSVRLPVWTKIQRPKATDAVGHGGRGTHARVAGALAPHDSRLLQEASRLFYMVFSPFFFVIPLHTYTAIYLNT
jgi:hypothetical protein